MGQSKKRSFVPYVAVLTVVIIGSYSYFRFRNQNTEQQPPEKTVEQILQERKLNASQQMASPLGVLFSNRNWDEFSKIFDPQKDQGKLAELIRAGFIQDGLRSFTPGDHDRLLSLVIQSLLVLDPKKIHFGFSLFFQAERLPSPPKNSLNYRQLEKWMLDSKSPLHIKKLSLKMLVVSAEFPDPKWVKVLSAGITDGLFNLGFAQVTEMIQEIRNIRVRDQMVRQLFQSYSRLSIDDQPAALVLISAYAEISPKQILSFAYRSLDAKKSVAYESALRAIGNLLRKKLLSDEDKILIRKRISNPSADLNTPYVSAKTQEILNEL